MPKILSVYNRLQAGDYENGNGGKRRVSRLTQFIHATLQLLGLRRSYSFTSTLGHHLNFVVGLTTTAVWDVFQDVEMAHMEEDEPDESLEMISAEAKSQSAVDKITTYRRLLSISGKRFIARTRNLRIFNNRPAQIRSALKEMGLDALANSLDSRFQATVSVLYTVLCPISELSQALQSPELNLLGAQDHLYSCCCPNWLHCVMMLSMAIAFVVQLKTCQCQQRLRSHYCRGRTRQFWKFLQTLHCHESGNVASEQISVIMW